VSLAPGDKLGPYEILAPLGAGGMGEVYRARDTKLDREVAIKILPDALAHNPERLARFEREAKVLASLNHPNIAQIYGVEDRALVMELVEGETLGGPLPVATALDYARQIAEALEAAHDKGITHRDLKPANVKVTPQGVVKVLDFGLAAVAQAPDAGPDSRANSPTLTIGVTEAGVIMGTAGYMSPEQAAGKPVDRRADIWSFGVMLWELLTGERLFDAETISHTLADVLRAPIDLDKLPRETPTKIRDLLRRCLDRNVRKRLRDIGEARIALENPQGEEPVAASAPSPSRLGWLHQPRLRECSQLRSRRWPSSTSAKSRRSRTWCASRFPRPRRAASITAPACPPTAAGSHSRPRARTGEPSCGFTLWSRSNRGLWPARKALRGKCSGRLTAGSSRSKCQAS